MTRKDQTEHHSLNEIHLRLMKMRNAVVQKREQQASASEPATGKVSRQEIILNMASQLAASVYRDLPRQKQQHSTEGKLRAAALDLLKAGEEVDAVSEKLQEMFG